VTHAVSMTSGARKGLAALASEYQVATIRAIEGLAQDPRPNGCKKMKGEFAGAYRIKVRAQVSVIYEVNDKALTVLVVVIEKRGDAY